MSYAATTDIEALLDSTLDDTSHPTATEAGVYLSTLESEMRGALRLAGYETDPVDADAINILRLYCATGATAYTLGAQGRHDQQVVYQRRYDAWLALVRQGNAGGLTMVSGVSGILPSSNATKHPSRVVGPHYHRDRVQW